MRVEIETHELVTRKMIGAVVITIEEIRLNESATIKAMLYDDLGLFVESRTFPMVGDDYAQWGSDDSYIVQFTLSRLGFVEKPSAPAADAPVPVS